MHVFVRNCLPFVCASLWLVAAAPGFAGTTGVYLPPAPSGSGGEDSIETSGGTRCRQSMNSNGSYLDVGVAGSAASSLPQDANRYSFNDGRDREATVYARVSIPLGKRPERIDCSRVYELELEKLRREVELLRLGIE
ncbi:MAG: hypothetical protein R3E04_02900 [Sphingobium sp.]